MLGEQMFITHRGTWSKINKKIFTADQETCPFESLTKSYYIILVSSVPKEVFLMMMVMATEPRPRNAIAGTWYSSLSFNIVVSV